jgi:hypothetical protein
MINEHLTPPFACMTLIHHYDLPLPQVIQSKILPMLSLTQRMPHLKKPQLSKILFKENGELGGADNMIKGPHFKLKPFGGDPTNYIITVLPQPNRIQKLKERRNQSHLPIMH